jgi:hypothetical protein
MIDWIAQTIWDFFVWRNDDRRTNNGQFSLWNDKLRKCCSFGLDQDERSGTGWFLILSRVTRRSDSINDKTHQFNSGHNNHSSILTEKKSKSRVDEEFNWTFFSSDQFVVSSVLRIHSANRWEMKRNVQLACWSVLHRCRVQHTATSIVCRSNGSVINVLHAKHSDQRTKWRNHPWLWKPLSIEREHENKETRLPHRYCPRTHTCTHPHTRPTIRSMCKGQISWLRERESRFHLKIHRMEWTIWLFYRLTFQWILFLRPISRMFSLSWIFDVPICSLRFIESICTGDQTMLNNQVSNDWASDPLKKTRCVLREFLVRSN